MKYLSICSGIEAASVAWEPLGWEAVGFSEIEPFPRAVLAHRFPHVPLHGDFTALIESPPSCDVLVGGTPCFPAGALILSRRGLVPIEEIRVGDEVLTHKQRWRKVVALMSREAATVVVKGQGHDGLVTTEEHPFWSKATARKWDNSRRNWTKTRSQAGWVDAKDMRGKHWATPCSVPAAAPPACEGVVFSEEFFWVVGAWLGDGWTSLVPRTGRKTGKQNRVLVCAQKGSQSEEIAKRISAAGLRAGRSSQRTTDRFQMTSKSLSFWLREHFGQGAEHKTIPAWVLGMPESWRRALLDGYLFADGHTHKETQKVTTVSRKLVVGVRLLAASLGRASSVVLNKPRRNKPLTIEGRAVQELGFFWQVSLPSRSRSAFVEDDCVWGLVRSVRSTGRVERVYNFEVAEDNSYVVDGMIVHNCQAFSVAGSRRSLDDARGNLSLAYVMLADAIDRRNREEGKEPCIAVWENVPGVFSTKDNAFGFFLRGLAGCLPGEDGPLEPPGGKWTHCGAVLGPQRAVAWRVLDAQYFGLAQRRQRVFVVASAREGFDPTSVLLEWEGMRRDSAPSRQARQNPAAASGIGAAERGGARPEARPEARHGSLSHLDGPQHPHPTLNQSFNTGAIGYSNQELFSQRGAGLVDVGEVTGALTARFGGSAMDAPEVDAGLYIPAYLVGGSVADDGGLNERGDVIASQEVAGMSSFGISSDAVDRSGEGDGSAAERAGLGIVEELQPTLRARANNSVAHGPSFPWLNVSALPASVANGVGGSVAVDAVALRGREGGNTAELSGEIQPALRTGGGDSDKPHVLVAASQDPFVFDTTQVTHPENRCQPKPGDPSHPLAAADHPPTLAASVGDRRMVVRRLTPRECERLQGFPDDWTLIPWKNKSAVDCPDGPRYKALGNSMAVPCMRWIGRRIAAHVAALEGNK